MARATVITDASYCHKVMVGGWAAWVRVDGVSSPVTLHACFKGAVTCSREAEMLAAINGVWLAVQHGATDVLLQTDCMAVVDMFNGTTKKPLLKREFADAMQRAGVNHITRKAKHVRGHTRVADARSYVNRWCDVKAREAMRRARAKLLNGGT